MYIYAGHHEVRFKITDDEAELSQEIANLLFISGKINKPNKQALAKWSLMQTLEKNRDLVIQTRLERQQRYRQLVQQYRARQLMQQQGLADPVVYQD